MSYTYVALFVQIVIAVVAGIVIIRYTRVRWVGILIILVGLVTGGVQLCGLMATDWMLSSYATGFKYASPMLSMYRLDSRYDRANGPWRDQLRGELLDACHRVQELYRLDLTMHCVDGIDWRTFPNEELANAHILANIRILDMDPTLPNRAEAFARLFEDYGVYAYGHLHDWQRVALIVEKKPRPVIWGKLVIQSFGPHCDRVIAYCLSDWYVRKQQYDIALAHLERALGKEWARSGHVDQWWQQHLPPRPEDHLFFGYVWYKVGNTQNALREFRKARGKDAGTGDMDQFYKSSVWDNRRS
jgi:hypothetical protein